MDRLCIVTRLKARLSLPLRRRSAMSFLRMLTTVCFLLRMGFNLSLMHLIACLLRPSSAGGLARKLSSVQRYHSRSRDEATRKSRRKVEIHLAPLSLKRMNIQGKIRKLRMRRNKKNSMDIARE